jgi:hypothetical protein
MMYDDEKSDPAIAAVKPTNKAGQPAAELAEPRAGAEGNVSQQSRGRELSCCDARVRCWRTFPTCRGVPYLQVFEGMSHFLSITGNFSNCRSFWGPLGCACWAV